MAKAISAQDMSPLYGGCPLLGESVMRGFTVKGSSSIDDHWSNVLLPVCNSGIPYAVMKRP